MTGREKLIQETAQSATNCAAREMSCSDCKTRGMYGCAAYDLSCKYVGLLEKQTDLPGELTINGVVYVRKGEK